MNSGVIPAVECTGLTHRYGEHTVVDRLDLRIERGEAFGLLGPNGAGKTTTIRLLTTLMPIQQGEVRVLGFEVGRRNTDIRYNLGYVPQQLSIEAALTGRQNVTWFARLFDVPRKERARRVEEVLAAMDLLEVADRLAASYSGGMVRRLELAQALVNRPALLILDEPTVGLDPIARDGVWQRVRELRHRFGTTVLLTTHYMEEADALCDRIALLHKGVLRAEGAPHDLKTALGPGATLEDVFRHHAGAGLAEDTSTEGGIRGVRSTRRTAQRAG
ncbi:ATP-binding cassette domain-containing protein [Nocardia transvalensis]|uniref:ATP-binding cassette domain-containing protein n=1 Tax=Nocardia transvalensis TaxID=37333 RepID=UPI0018935056|nr:ATP-binding cassette domain-containing protein [Nocardia transvalensis]MBF6334221.1 ATP-binding cassette domain-containing protein [Nocardia transvalensis]